MQRLIPIFSNQCVVVVLGLASAKITSHLVPPDVNGAYQVNFVSLTQLGILLTHPGVINHTLRYWQREKHQTGAYARFLWQVCWRRTKYLVPLLLALSIGSAFSQDKTLWLLALPFLLIANVALAINAVASAALNAEERHWHLFWLNATTGIARVFVPAAFVILFGASYLTLGAGFALHALTPIAAFLVLFPRALGQPEPLPEAEERWSGELRSYGRPFAWLGMGGWLLQFADRWAVWLFFGDAQAGIFAMASSLSSYGPTLVQGSLMQRVFPGIFRQADAAHTPGDWHQLARRCDQLTIVFVITAALGLFLLNLVGPHLVGWLIDSRYAPAMEILFAAGMAMVTVQINQFQYLLLQGQHNSLGMVKVMLVVASLKTFGTVIAAMISWEAFLGWLVVSPVLCGLLGRALIQHIALGTVTDRASRPNKSAPPTNDPD